MGNCFGVKDSQVFNISSLQSENKIFPARNEPHVALVIDGQHLELHYEA